MQFRLNASYVVLAVIVFLAFLLRISGLGTLDFGPDEILHIYAAKEIIEGRPPILPSGVLYDRALPYTEILALIGRYFGLTEWSARWPGVIFGVLTVILVYVMGRAWYSNAVGLTAASLIALVPSAIAFSQEVRMYAAFQFLYLLAIFLFMRGLEPTQRAAGQPVIGYYRKFTASLDIKVLPLIMSGVVMLIAYRVHNLTAPAMLGPFAYVACMGMVSSAIKGTPRAKYVLILATVALIGAITLVLRPELPRAYLRAVSWVPVWAEPSVTDWKYYLLRLRSDHPIIFSTLALATLYALLQKPKATLFLVCCLAVPLALHSFIFAWKGDRYIFHLLPVMYILWAAGFAAVVVFLHASAVNALTRYLRQGQASLIGGVLVAACVLAAVWMTPWFYATKTMYVSSRPMTEITRHPKWKGAMTHVRAHARSGDVVISPFVLLARYYGPSLPVYLLNPNMRYENDDHNLRDARGRLLDYQGGAPVINDVEDLRTILRSHRGAWVIRDRPYFHHGTTPVAIQKYIESACQQHPVAAAPDMMVWYCMGDAPA